MIASKPFPQHRLVIILLFCFLLLSLTVIEQNRTIQNQRLIIQSLFADSMVLHNLQQNNLNVRRN